MSENMVEHAMALTRMAWENSGSDDPCIPFVQLVTAAAIAGLFISRDSKEVHEVLDKVWPAAEQIVRDLEGSTVQ